MSAPGEINEHNGGRRLGRTARNLPVDGRGPSAADGGLLELEERFAREYLADLNATQAYLRIRPNVKQASARVEGCRLLANPNVLDLIAGLKREQFTRLEISADRVLRELALIGFSDIRHYQVDPVTGRLDLVPGVDAERARALASVKHRNRTGGSGNETWTEHTVELRLWDKVVALVKMGEHLKLFKQDPVDRSRVEVVVDPDGTVRIISAEQQ